MSQPTTIREVVAAAGEATAQAIAARLVPPVVAVPAETVTVSETNGVVPVATETTHDATAAETTTSEATADAPTGDAKGMAFKAVCVDEQGVIYGIGAMAGNVDRDGEIVTKDALLGMAYDFCAAKARTFYANHDKSVSVEADLVASMPGAPILKSGRVLQAGDTLPDDDPVVGIDIQKGNEIAWFIGIKPNDAAVVEAARKGDVVGFSWGGYAAKE